MSPFPDESWLTTAEKFHPGTTGMLLEDFIAERKHSRAVDRRAARLDEKSFEKFAEYQNTQLALAGLIALIIAVGGIILALTDHSTAGLAVLVAETTGLVAALLVAGRRRPGAEIEKPSDGSAGPPTAGE